MSIIYLNSKKIAFTSSRTVVAATLENLKKRDSELMNQIATLKAKLKENPDISTKKELEDNIRELQKERLNVQDDMKDRELYRKITPVGGSLEKMYNRFSPDLYANLGLPSPNELLKEITILLGKISDNKNYENIRSELTEMTSRIDDILVNISNAVSGLKNTYLEALTKYNNRINQISTELTSPAEEIVLPLDAKEDDLRYL